MKTSILILLSSLLGIGCNGSNVYTVSKTADGGLPFYPIVPATKTTQVHEQRFDLVKMTLIGDDKAPVSLEFYVHDTKPCTSADIMPSLAAAVADSKQLPAAFKVIGSCVSPPTALKCGDAGIAALPIIRNETAFEMVTAPEPLYVNVFTPYGGQANGEFSFNEQGALTSAKGTMTDSYPAALTEAMTSLAGTIIETAAGVFAPNKLNPEPGPMKFTIAITPQRRTYTTISTAIPHTIEAGGKQTTHKSCSVIFEPSLNAQQVAEAATPKPKDAAPKPK